ncbi:acyl-CoA dehydrogenase family protein [Bacillus coahuilensis]|uniref:acyl-CoA dehydrogenase family protein n=2 Tax=Bacillus coahuilensis TaxID=408580 RepID=UPI0009E73E0F|nr:acyl-CoA dehydrogenase family protein [Bacillus coahuilensis]
MKTKRQEIQGGEFIVRTPALHTVFTPEDVTDEQRMLMETAKRFVEDRVDPYRSAIEDGEFDEVVRLLREAGELGLLAHSVPEVYGGLGLNKVTKGIVGEMTGRTSGYGVAHSNHTCIATLPITYFGTEKQKQKYLPKLASGEYIGAYCLTEPNAGSDALASKTKAILNNEGSHYILNGTKIYITNASFSDTFIVYAKVDGQHFTAFIVEKGFPGLVIGPEEKKMGIKGSSTCSVLLEDCLVPKENVLGEIGKGHVIALNVLNLGRYNLGFAAMGGAIHALDTTMAFIKERKQFGRRISDFPASKEKIIKMAARIFAAESIQYRTGGLLDSRLEGLKENALPKEVAAGLMEYIMECAICKVYGSETLDMVVDEGLQLHGGAGYIAEYPIEQMYRDSRINRIFEGTNEINRLVLPTQLLKKLTIGAYSLNEKGREETLLSTVREINRSLSVLLITKYGEALQHEQEVMMKWSDSLIEYYALESSCLRNEKSGGAYSALVQLLEFESLLRIESIWKQLVSEVVEGDERKNWLVRINKVIVRYLPTIQLEQKRNLADQLIHEGFYKKALQRMGVTQNIEEVR